MDNGVYYNIDFYCFINFFNNIYIDINRNQYNEFTVTNFTFTKWRNDESWWMIRIFLMNSIIWRLHKKQRKILGALQCRNVLCSPCSAGPGPVDEPSLPVKLELRSRSSAMTLSRSFPPVVNRKCPVIDDFFYTHKINNYS